MHKLPLLLVLPFLQQPRYTTGPATSSPRRPGPHQMEGWVEKYDYPALESQGPLPSTLVLARHGRVLRRIQGAPFLWAWMFVGDGRQVAFEAGPLHFGLSCLLVDVRSGRQVARYDCFAELTEDAPSWVKALERQASSQTPR